MTLYDSILYQHEVQTIAALPLEWEKLFDKTVLITGASGMIGSFLIDVLLAKSEELHCRIVAVGRNENKARIRFGKYLDGSRLRFLEHDVCRSFADIDLRADYVLHLASNTHPLAYAAQPIETISANIIGTQNVLDFAVRSHAKRALFASSVEIYGENRGDVQLFDEHYCGYIDCNTMRACYNEGKRAGEALCQAYRHQRGLQIVIPRFPRTYGPTMQMEDSKASSQFIKKAAAGEDIVLKSKGTQYFSYLHAADAASGALFCLLHGTDGEAYNVAEVASNVHLSELAAIAAGAAGTKVVFEVPEESERAGYSVATKALLDGSKIRTLGWREQFPVQKGMRETIQILREIVEGNMGNRK